MDDGQQWHESKRKGSNLYMDELSVDIFCQKIENICDELGCNKRQREYNKSKLKNLVLI